MQSVGDGKYCSNCSNVVYDFSGLNDDELLNFFKNNPNTHCGRFHNSQLNRNILPTKKKRRLFINRFNKIAAAVFTVLSFKHIGLYAAGGNAKPAFTLDAHFKKSVSKPDEKIIITGRIRDRNDKLLAGAVVMFDSMKVAITDKNGEFHFELESVTVNTHNLYFSYDSLITVVRTYHPVMQSTDYDIVLYKNGNGEGYHTAGIMAYPFLKNPDLPSLVFTKGSMVVSKTNKHKLDIVSSQLKENPVAEVDIIVFTNSAAVTEKTGLRRAEEIKKYLVEFTGISSDRLTIKIRKSGGDINTIDIVNHDPNN